MSFRRPSIASSAALALVAVAALLQCKDPDPRCEKVDGTVPEKLTLRRCADGVDRDLTCSRNDPEQDWICLCQRGGKLGATFSWPAATPPVTSSDRRELEGFVLRKCGWSLALK